MNAPVWKPAHPQKSRMWQFMMLLQERHGVVLNDYQQLHEWSVQNSAQFWQAICDYFAIQFTTPAKEILNKYTHPLSARWFEGATLNFAEQLLQRRDDHPALISIGENGQRCLLSYRELYELTAQCAAALRKVGVKKGDRVAGIMPNVQFTVIAMLATTSLGAIWSSCSSDFGAQAAIDRIGQIEPTVLFCSDGHQYMGKIHESEGKIAEVQKAIPSLKKIVVCPGLHLPIDISYIPNTVWWDEFLQPANECEFEAVPFAHPAYILFSSGTTGKPKCIVHSVGGTLLQHVKELGLHTDLQANDNLLFYTTCGWMMWNWMVSALALGITVTLYEGAPAYPDLLRLFKVIDEENVTVFGTSPKFLSSLEKANVSPKDYFSLSSLRTILSTGSPLLPRNYDFVKDHIKHVQLSSIAGGTDIISCFALGNPLKPVLRGEIQSLGLGMAVEIFNAEGQSILAERGELVCTNAFPSMPVGFWNDTDNKIYQHSYFDRFPNVWAHGDYAEITKNYGLIIYGRSDTVLNPGGVRIGTAEIYRQVEKIAEVVDSVVIGQDWDDDVRVILFVQLQSGIKLDAELENKIRQIIRKNASPRHVPAKILQVPDIPRTISGKVVELAVRQIVHNQEINNRASLANPEALEHFRNRKELGS